MVFAMLDQFSVLIVRYLKTITTNLKIAFLVVFLTNITPKHDISVQKFIIKILENNNSSRLQNL